MIVGDDDVAPGGEATSRPEDDEALGLQAIQRFAHRYPTDPELPGQHFLPQLGTGRRSNRGVRCLAHPRIGIARQWSGS